LTVEQKRKIYEGIDMDFYNSTEIKIITLFIVVVTFLVTPYLQGLVAKKLPDDLQKPYKKLAKDAFVKTLVMFSAAAFFGALAFFKGDIEKAITQSVFALCLFTGVGSIWTIIKTKDSIREARDISIAGNREWAISQIEFMNSKLAKNATIMSLIIGLSGCIYMVLLYDTYTLNWVWFVAFIATGPAMLSARCSEAANTAISTYVSDPEFGV
jgi:uncharacterized membrane protein